METRKFNIYYKNSRVNLRPLSLDEVNIVRNQKVIYKKDPLTKEYVEIPVNKLEFVSCIII